MKIQNSIKIQNSKFKILAVVQARMSSTRLPGKILKEIAGRPMLRYVLEGLKKSKKIDKLVVATSNNKDDDATEEFCRKNNFECFRGSRDDVLKRFADCAKKYPEYEVIVRVTGDCPLIDPEVVDKVISVFEKEDADYASNVLKETYPDGIDVEVFTRQALLESDKEAKLSSEREHVTLYIRNNPKYKKVNVENGEDLSRFRLTVDNPEDFEVIKFLIENYGSELGFEEYCDLLLKNPKIMAKNAKIMRNEGLKKSLKSDHNANLQMNANTTNNNSNLQMNANTTNKKNNIVYPELSYKIVGLLFNVHNNLGRFKNEKQYSDAVEQELKSLEISYVREYHLPKSFEGEKSNRNIIDFVIDNKIILEIKAKTATTKDDYLQVKRYLTSSNFRLGILVNFRRKYLTPKRVLRGSHL